MFNQNISLAQIVEDGGILCVGAKWVGDKKTHFYSEWRDGQEGMLKKVHAMMCEADATLTYNGNSFDLPRLRGRFALHKLPPVPPVASIDVYQTIKKLGLTSGKLAFVGPFFEIGVKIKNAGWQLWRDVMDGDEKARKSMEKYCVGDVKLTEKVYSRLKPYIVNHPNTGTGGGSCATCGSHKIQKRGFRFTRLFRIQRLQCTDCGSWSDGSREKIK